MFLNISFGKTLPKNPFCPESFEEKILLSLSKPGSPIESILEMTSCQYVRNYVIDLSLQMGAGLFRGGFSEIRTFSVSERKSPADINGIALKLLASASNVCPTVSELKTLIPRAPKPESGRIRCGW